MATQKIHMEIPRLFGGGDLTHIGRAIEKALDGYVMRADRKPAAKPTAAPQPQKATQKATPKAKAATAPTRTVYVPVEAPKPLNRDQMYAKIVAGAGGDVPQKIAAFVQTSEGAALYREYRDAPLPPIAKASAPEHEKGAMAQLIEQTARKEQQPGETIEAAVLRMLNKYPNLYAAHRDEMDKRRLKS